MNASKKGAVDADSLATLWGPRLLRFYLLICANRGVAEQLTLETLIEAVRSQGSRAHHLGLARLALTKASGLRRATQVDDDRIARAVISLPPSQRHTVALVRGMSLGIDEVAEVMRMTISESKRLFADGVLELHRLNAHCDGRISSALCYERN